MNIKERKMYIPEQHYNLYKQKQNKTKQNPAKIKLVKFYWTDFTREELFIVTIHVLYNNQTLPLFI